MRINEAVGIADLFEVSLDSLLGRSPEAQRGELEYLLRALWDTALRSSHQVWTAMDTIREQLEELPKGFQGAEQLQKFGRHTWADRLFPAHDALMGLVDLSHELLRREQGRPELSEEAMMEFEVPADEAQS